MKQYPKVKFQLNRELDNEICFEFLDLKAGGVDFGKGIIEIYPELDKAKLAKENERRVIIDEFTRKYYIEHGVEIDKSLIKMNKDWEDSSQTFFKSVDDIFGHFTWPIGEYICYLSIFDCNPRFLENKTFQVFYRHNLGTNFIVAHEMLHFAFFDYLENNEAALNKRLNEHAIWLLSEWFDDIVLGLPEFEEFGSDSITGYPEVVEYSQKFGKLDQKNFTINNFFKVVKTRI